MFNFLTLFLKNTKMNSDAANISCRFKEFRQRSLFIDCIFTSWNKPEIPAHRIILSKNSTLLKNYFAKNPLAVTGVKMSIPFNTPDHSFVKIVNFFYNNTIDMSKENIIVMLAHSIIYGINHLEQMIMDIANDFVSKSTAMNFMKQIVSFTISADSRAKFPEIEQNYNRFIEAIDFIAKFVANNYSIDEIYQYFDCVNPRLLSMILTYSTITDKQKVKIIDDFVGDRQLTLSDMEYLTNVINWSNPESYTYLTFCNCDWVLPRVSRRLYSTILTHRSVTIHAFNKKVSNLQDPHIQQNGVPQMRKFQNWFPFAWFSIIWESKGLERTPEVELSEFIGTLGGLVPFFNPVSYNLLEPFTSKPLHQKNFSDSYIFEDSSKYFLSYSPNKSQPCFIGFKMKIPCFKLRSILVTFDNRERGKPFAPNERLTYNELGKMKLLVSDINGKTKFPNPVIPGVKFECNQTPISYICIIPEQASDRDQSTQKCLRVSRLKSFGCFDVD